MLPRKNKFKKSSSDAPGIDARAIFLLLVVVGCCVFVWGYYNSSAKDANASSGEKTIITRPVDNSK